MGDDRSPVLRLDEMKAKQPDGEKTEAAALRQIDACRTKKCLEDACAEWEQYLDENSISARKSSRPA